MTSVYDEYYKQHYDMLKKPYGYPLDYYMWRASKTKGEIAKFIRKDGLILDIGGGFGGMTQFLPTFINKDVSYINVDISSYMLSYCPYQKIIGTAENLPFRNNSFDYVICSEVLQHIKNKEKALREAYRVLKSSGLFLLNTPRTGRTADFKKSPFFIFLILDYLVKLLLRKMRRTANQTKISQGVVFDPVDEIWLNWICQSIGFNVLSQYRIDNHPPWGRGKFWRYFSDLFINPRKFGLYTFIVCKK